MGRWVVLIEHASGCTEKLRYNKIYHSNETAFVVGQFRFTHSLLIASLFTRFFLIYLLHTIVVDASIYRLLQTQQPKFLFVSLYPPLPSFHHGSAYWCVALPLPPSPPRPTSSWKTLQMLVLLMKSLSMMATRKYESWMAWISALEADSSS